MGVFIKQTEDIMNRIGVIGIVIKGTDKVLAVQSLLSTFSEIIIGRMGVPDHESGINTISVIVKGSVEKVSALTGKLGKIEDVTVKSALTAVEIDK